MLLSFCNWRFFTGLNHFETISPTQVKWLSFEGEGQNRKIGLKSNEWNGKSTLKANFFQQKHDFREKTISCGNWMDLGTYWTWNENVLEKGIDISFHPSDQILTLKCEEIPINFNEVNTNEKNNIRPITGANQPASIGNVCLCLFIYGLFRRPGCKQFLQHWSLWRHVWVKCCRNRLFHLAHHHQKSKTGLKKWKLMSIQWRENFFNIFEQNQIFLAIGGYGKCFFSFKKKFLQIPLWCDEAKGL